MTDPYEPKSKNKKSPDWYLKLVLGVTCPLWVPIVFVLCILWGILFVAFFLIGIVIFPATFIVGFFKIGPGIPDPFDGPDNIVVFSLRVAGVYILAALFSGYFVGYMCG